MEEPLGKRPTCGASPGQPLPGHRHLLFGNHSHESSSFVFLPFSPTILLRERTVLRQAPGLRSQPSSVSLPTVLRPHCPSSSALKCTRSPGLRLTPLSLRCRAPSPSAFSTHPVTRLCVASHRALGPRSRPPSHELRCLSPVTRLKSTCAPALGLYNPVRPTELPLGHPITSVLRRLCA